MMDTETLEARAERELDPGLYTFIARAAGDRTAVGGNRQAFKRRRLVPRVLPGGVNVDASVELLGRRISTPIGIAPLPRLQAASPDGELDLARAAATADVLYCAPTNASRTLEELAEPGGPRWFQLYPHADGAITDDLMRRAEDSGYEAIVVTVDRAKATFAGSAPEVAGNDEVFANFRRYGGMEVMAGRHDPSFGWAALERLCTHARVPVVAKGLLHPGDARRAIASGCRGVWVSNHGGRLLDRVIAPLDALGGIAQEVGDDAEVYVDGGAATAADVAVGLASGARAVFLGRVLAYRLALDGAEAVRTSLEAVKGEFSSMLQLLGVPSPSALGREHVVTVN